ncbi:hypothetical protein SENE111051_20505 [Serratia nematodiphila]|uniref:Uncharacterized protein n=1 Tax=Serratia nematodiphila TaxID=458197 RepID=A0A1G5LCL9_9GAMM|nr:hypothetical protein [Serratia nematodiphila]KFF89793.1 hypothetical protein JL05_17325 [Serratia nematodiphila DZ0503SBS1]UTO03661.1 hypothetical protein NLX84_11750 [Serratia nematodiphila]SCZ10364.1 hypothetical protein SAMN02927935_04200 [Serratia nematodiphila]HEI9811147.1 hypothetical protein [Serratia marcescens]
MQELLKIGNWILSTFQNGTLNVMALGAIFLIFRWLFRDISSIKLFGLMSDRYRKRLVAEKKNGIAEKEYAEIVDFEIKRTSIKKIIGISNSHIQNEMIKIIMSSHELLGPKYFSKFNFFISLKSGKVFVDEGKIKRRYKDAFWMMLFSFSFLIASFVNLRSDPLFGFVLFVLWGVFLLISIAAFPPSCGLRKKAQEHIDAYYSDSGR